MHAKLLAIDIDGTLLRRDGSIHPDDLEAIERLRARGVPLALVTGRLYSGARPVAQAIRLSGPVACVDGSQLVDTSDDRPLVTSPIAGGPAQVLREVVARHGLVSFLFSLDTILYDGDGEPYLGYVRTWSPCIEHVPRVLEHLLWDHETGLMALVGIGAEPCVRAAADELRSRIDHAAHALTFPVARLGLHAMLVRAAGPTKGTAIRWLAEHHACTPADVVAVGDWLNDLPMFAVAGRSFAMGQAPVIVKEAATEVLSADALRGGGIAEAIRRAWGI